MVMLQTWQNMMKLQLSQQFNFVARQKYYVAEQEFHVVMEWHYTVIYTHFKAEIHAFSVW